MEKEEIMTKKIHHRKRIKKTKDERRDLFYRIVMFFTIGCFAGVVFETILCYCQRGHFESRQGLIYGPFNPVYGFGLAIMVFILERYKKNSAVVLVGGLLGGAVEYICSWIQETFFGTTSWDYSNYFLNFDGRTSIYHMMWWGILSLVFMRFVYPYVKKIIYKIKEKDRYAVAITFVVFFAFDMLISAGASVRQYERVQNIKATTNIQKFFDKHYPDELMNKVYPNIRDAKTKKKISEMK